MCCGKLLAPFTDQTDNGHRGFYFQAFNGSVTLPVAGCDYNSDRTYLLVAATRKARKMKVGSAMTPATRPVRPRVQRRPPARA